MKYEILQLTKQEYEARHSYYLEVDMHLSTIMFKYLRINTEDNNTFLLGIYNYTWSYNIVLREVKIIVPS